MIFNETYQKSAYNGIYSITELDDMIMNQEYVPIATVDEFTNFRNATTQTMGAGTRWAGSYATGMDKKYVQVRNIDFINVANFMPIGLSTGVSSIFSGIFDGNNLGVYNVKFNRPRIIGESFGFRGIFCRLSSAIIKNMRLSNCYFNASGSNISAGVVAGEIGANTTVQSIYISNSTVLAHQGIGAVAGQSSNAVGSTINITKVIVDNFKGYNSFTTLGYYGGVLGSIQQDVSSLGGTINITRCSCNNITFASAVMAGGILGYSQPNHGTVYVTNCNCTGSGFGAITYAGGIVGRALYMATKITNCYAATGNIAGTNSGGLAGTSSGVITNCYYDKDTSTKSDTGKGLPRSTSQMKQGIQDSTIDGEAMYTGWDSNIWDFGTIDEYPTIK